MKIKASQQAAFEHLLDISVQISKESNIDILMEKILMASVEISNADAGSIYLVNQSKELEFRTVYNDSMGLHLGGSSAEKITFPSVPLFVDDKPNRTAIVAHAANSGEVINIEDVYDALPYDFSAARTMDTKTGYRTKSMLTFPLKDHTDDIVGVIQLINAMEGNEIISFSKQVENQILSFASLGAIALTNKALIFNMEQLFESFAKTIAAAIDAKSPHTGGHCKRVPELTLMIADAVHDYDEGPLATFKLSDEERHQLNIAGWLHDCGKIATPDHVIEKSRKLQTIFDRIHYVSAKLEIASRDIDLAVQDEIIAALKLGKTVQVQQLERKREVAQKQLQLDKAFLLRVNIGGEFLTDEQAQMIHTIATRYQITLDSERQNVLTTNEIDNLSVKRGTLNNEERSIIQKHMDVTLNILEALPFPKHLANVAEYALGHHETMDGKGYPRGLVKAQMSVPARLMAIADVFEALSASDRPYKSAKPVSECLTIMSNMVKNNHLDPDLFTIFVRSKVYEKYIHKFADPKQIDDFNIEAILPTT
ncbi:HD family phosphohydrolase [Colwellia sp. KU-HH00111]|uniref:HD domain-containing phosphohydrolase n=1 Tax=Colwellia sp. KU-HH00111 TaxID=3127652 RepID=UPI00310B7A6E